MRLLQKRFFDSLIIIFLSGCGFNAPYSTRLKVPDGPPEFQAGWHDGCSSGLNGSAFQNARFNPITFGNGIYQHDPVYQMAYGRAFFYCSNQSATGFVGQVWFQGPLE